MIADNPRRLPVHPRVDTPIISLEMDHAEHEAQHVRLRQVSFHRVPYLSIIFFMHHLVTLNE